MKNLSKVSILCLLMTALWFSCKKECPEAEVPATEYADDQLIAYLDGNAGTLYAAPDQVELVLFLYGAQPAGNSTNLFSLLGQTPEGDEVLMSVRLQTAPADKIRALADASAEGPKPESKVHANCDCSDAKEKKATDCKHKKLEDGTEYNEKTVYEGLIGNITYTKCKPKAGSDCVEWKSIIGHVKRYVNDKCEGLAFDETPIYEFVCRK